VYPNLKLCLWQSRFRQNRLAKLLHIDEAVLSRIVNGFREPSAELQRSIATILNRDIDWLFYWEEVSMLTEDSCRDIHDRAATDSQNADLK
jgi:transcriptional regulator with XRE-family HTH domain